MNFEEFCENIRSDLMMLLPDVNKVLLQEIEKNNGVVYTAVLPVSEKLNIEPAIYLDYFYQEYLNGRLYENVLYDIANTYEKYKPVENFDTASIRDWNLVKGHVVRKLINYDANREMLAQLPHKQVEDLAVVYQIYVSDPISTEEYASIMVHNGLFEDYGISLEEMDRKALENTRELMPPFFMNLGEFLFSMVEDMDAPLAFGNEVYLLSNAQRTNGAVHVLDPKVMDMVAEQLGEKFFVIPSSVHECLLMPYDRETSYRELEEMIHEVNHDLLTPTEILSEKAYVVDARNHVFLRANKWRQYEKQLCQKEEEKTAERKPEILPKL